MYTQKSRIKFQSNFPETVSATAMILYSMIFVLNVANICFEMLRFTFFKKDDFQKSNIEYLGRHCLLSTFIAFTDKHQGVGNTAVI